MYDECGIEGNSNTKKVVTPSESSSKTVYGELYLLGLSYKCSAYLPTDRKSLRKCSKFVLEKRNKPNGVKKASTSVVKAPESSKVVQDSNKFSMCYTISDKETIVVEYDPDEETDMFQIGRGTDDIIDFIVFDKDYREKGKVHQSAVSRFACRIIVERSNPINVRLYAAGFDSKKNIVFGRKAVKWRKNDNTDMDALTTNGVLLSNPKGALCGGSVESSIWREVSVCGSIFSVRGPRSSEEKGCEIESATNILSDGSLIDLCGVTLLWRSAEGLKKCATKEYIEGIIEKLSINCALLPGRSTRENSIVIPRSNSSCDLPSDTSEHPYVYLLCGHVHTGNSLPTECPTCHTFGPSQKLSMGMEAGFYVDDVADNCTPKIFAFSPCGHIATEKTVKFWAKSSVPHRTHSYCAVCPFCASELEGCPGYVALKFSFDYDSK